MFPKFSKRIIATFVAVTIAMSLVLTASAYGNNDSWQDRPTGNKNPSWYYEDYDGDGLINIHEIMLGYNFYVADSNGNGIFDGDEDLDGDGVPNLYEIDVLGTDPTIPDTDGNGITDGNEDFDNDGLKNKDEFVHGTSPFNADTDGDGLTDYAEVITHKTDPLNADTDGDGFTDKQEIDGVSAPDGVGTSKYKTDPTKWDTDGDLISDFDEIAIGLNPLVQKTNGTTLDSQRTFSGTISENNPIVSDINANNPFNVSIEATVAGNLRSITVDNSVMPTNNASVGQSLDFKYQSNLTTPNVKISFKIDTPVQAQTYALPVIAQTLLASSNTTNLTDFIIYKYFEDVDGYLPIVTKYNYATNTVYAETDKFGTYTIVDATKVFDTILNQFHDSDTINYYPTAFEEVLKKAKKNPANGHYYLAITDTSKNWEFAKAYCENFIGHSGVQKAHLVTITSQAEQDFVANLTKNGSVSNYFLRLSHKRTP